jgi:hypothetical protein
MSDDTALAVEVLKRMSTQDDTLSEIHKQTVKTNGRVTGLEMREAAREAVRQDRAERLRIERVDRADELEASTAAKEKKRDRKVMIFGALCGLFSGTASYVVLHVAHLL